MVPCSLCRAIVVAIAVLAGAAPALAAPRVAALVPTLRGGGAAELRDKFQEAVARGLTDAGIDNVPVGEVRMRLAGSDAFTCAGPGSCAQKVAGMLRADDTIASEIVIAGKDYTIRLKLIDAAGKELARSEDTCDICTVKEADDAVAKASSKLIGANRALLNVAPTTMSAVTPPPPPQPRVETPPPPPPQPRVETPPPVPPQAMTPTPPAQEKKMFPWRGLAIGSLALGVVGLAVGIPLVVIDGEPTCSAPAGQNPHKVCANVYNTAGGGGTLIAAGVLGLAASGVLFYFDYRARHKPPATVSVVPLLQGGAMATVGTRF